MVLNCTLKPAPATSHTQGLLDRAITTLRATGVAVDEVRASQRSEWDAGYRLDFENPEHR